MDLARVGVEAAERIRATGVKVTGPRVAILAALVDAKSHPDAEQLFDSLKAHHPSLSLSTVYKTLEAFLAAGLCRRVRGDGSRLRVDGSADDHDHAVCRGCGRIFDIEQALFPRPATPLALPGGLTLTAIRLEYEVLCPGCRAEGTSVNHEPPAPRPRERRGTTTTQREE